MVSRRSVLQTGAAVGGITSLAGCSRDGTDTSDSNETQSDSTNNTSTEGTAESDGGGVSFDGETTAYTEWMFNPAEINVESAGFGYTDVTTLLDSDAKSASELESYYGAMFGDRLSVDDIEYSLTMNQFVILSGNVDGATLANGLGLSEEGEYRDFTVFTDDGGFLLAESTDYVLAGRGAYGIESDNRMELKLAIDTYVDERDRYVEREGAYEDLMSQLSTATVSYGDLPAPSVAEEADESDFLTSAVTQEIRDDQLALTVVELYGGETDVDLNALEQEYETTTSEELTIVGTSQEGRLAMVELEGEPSDVDLEPI
ncbi:hypothetical protein SAMN04488556_3394 [Halostagnicola kamekurae]|uniref:Uncharacterized protein n=1 Tax=Halostagnicola kamekurae TaxID=619731 RepID=A0A1I6TT40_9EURY|nr:hypothetical protein SAMN04488556_3394 [Halostagnicola kamekurae]